MPNRTFYGCYGWNLTSYFTFGLTGLPKLLFILVNLSKCVISATTIAIIAVVTVTVTGISALAFIDFEEETTPQPRTSQPLGTTTSGLTEKVSVGVMLPSTGDLSSHGQDNSLAVHLALQDFNDYLEEMDASWRMDLVLFDTQSDPSLAQERIRTLNARGINLILGPESSAEVRGIKPYVDVNDMIVISPTSTSPSLSITDNIFRLIPDDTKQGKVLALLFEQEGIKAVIPIYRADEWGNGLYASTKSNFESLGGVMDEGLDYPPDTTVYSIETALLSNLVARYSADYTVDEIGILMIGFSETVHLLKSANSYGNLHDIRWFGSDGSSNDSILSGDPVAAGFMQDVNFVSTQFATSTNDVYEHVNDYFIEFKGATPNAYSFSAYDSLWILGKTIVATESTDPLVIGDALIDVASTHTGAIGTVNLNEFGDLAIADYDLWSVRGNTWYLSGHYDAVTDSIKMDSESPSEEAATEKTDSMSSSPIITTTTPPSSGLPDIIDVGVMLPSTGDLASHGQDSNIGVQIGVSDFNNYLKEIGASWQMNLVLEDTKSDPSIALEKIQLLDSRGIKFVLGPESSAEVRGVKPYADSNDMIIVSPTSTSPSLAVVDNIFRLIPDDTQQGKVLALFFEQEGIEAIIPIYRADEWGDGLYASTRSNFESLGGVMDDGVRYSTEISGYSDETQILSDLVDQYAENYGAEKVAVLMIGFSETVGLFNSAVSYENLHDTRWFGSDGSSNDSILSGDPVAAGFMQDVNFVSTQFATSTNDVYEHVNDYFIEFKGATPNAYTFSLYDCVWVLGKTILETQSVDPLVVGDALIDVAGTHTGAIGTVNLNEFGDLAIADYDLWSVRDGVWYKFGHFNADDSTFDFES